MKSQSLMYGASTLLLLLLFTAPGTAQEVVSRPSFEGVVKASFQTSVEIQFLELTVKRQRIHVDAEMRESGGTYYLIDYPARKRCIVMPSREQYIEGPAPAAFDDSRSAKNPVTFEKTDSTKEIAGYECDQLLVKLNDGEAEVWATTKLGTPGTLCVTTESMLADEEAWEKELTRFGYFPMKVILDDGSGDKRVMFEVTDVQKKKLSEALFVVPADYEKTTKDELIRQVTPRKPKAK